jgi:hypothetical protein
VSAVLGRVGASEAVVTVCVSFAGQIHVFLTCWLWHRACILASHLSPVLTRSHP